ncbi:MAG: PrsW family intramembrane metalloprotease [Halanaerobium sp.]|nr:PrsW family intramembrane metalloprotease [Halanaerobium sp.]
MQLLVLTLISLLPGIFWLWYFYRQDSIKPEPFPSVIKSFLWGMIVVIPVGIIEAPFSAYIDTPSNIYQLFFLSFIIVGLTEEFFKAIVVYLGPFRGEEFDEPVDGIIYAIAAALGFAVLENLMYGILFGREVGLIRGVITTLAHASFSGFFGYFLGQARVRGGNGFSFFLKGWIVASFFHGLYDFLVIGGLAPFGLVILMVAAFQVILANLITRAKRSRV